MFASQKAQSLSKEERAKTARKKKKRAGAKGKTVVSNTKKAKVRNMENGGVVKLILNVNLMVKTYPELLLQGVAVK